MQQHLTTQAVVYSAKSDAEKSFDYILPEYLPGISRIVKVSTAVEKCTFFAGMGDTGLSILLKNAVIYISEYDGRIKTVSFREEISVPFKEAFDFTGVFSAVPSCFVSYAHAFVQTPRKLSVKASIQASVTVYSEKSSPLFPQAEDKSICLLKDTVTVHSKKILPEAHFEKNEEISIDSAKGGISEIIHADARVLHTDVSVSDKEVSFEADVKLHILFESIDDDGGDVSYSCFDTVVKVGDTLNCDTVEAGDTAFLYIDISCVEPSVSLDAYGDNKLVSLVVKYSASGFAYGKKECELVTDAFMENCPDTPEFSAVDVDMIHSNISGKQSVSLTARADIRELSDISCCDAKIHSVSIEHSEGQFFATAKCGVQILGTNLSGELMSTEAPVVLHIPLGGENLVPSEVVPEVIIGISGCSAEIKDGGLKLDFEVSTNGVFILRSRHRLVCSLSGSGSTMQRKSGEIKIYYPAKGEGLWDIAKKYRVNPEDICSANNFNEKTLEGRHTVIIP